jgi:hypothetical protein
VATFRPLRGHQVLPISPDLFSIYIIFISGCIMQPGAVACQAMCSACCGVTEELGWATPGRAWGEGAWRTSEEARDGGHGTGWDLRDMWAEEIVRMPDSRHAQFTGLTRMGCALRSTFMAH